ncbi:MAG: GntR family transcriptional regulator [Hyphomonadaceae bacterium]|nr:GntR family transcriptional regulator [Hyphomonadaceae bacterium]
MPGSEKAADPRAGERVYREIKQAIIAGDLRLRQRLDIDTLAERWRVSATPVRQALAVLTAERLVSVESTRGYYVAFWSERELKELYEWRGTLARVAAETYAPEPIALTAAQRRAHTTAYALLMQHLEGNASRELRLAARSADERLHAALAAEAEALNDAAEDLLELADALGHANKRTLQARLKRYFRRRVQEAAAIRARASVKALPRNGD